MKKTLILGVSTAVVMVSLTGCVFDRPITTKYGIENPSPEIVEDIDNTIPDVYGPEVKNDNSDTSIPVAYGAMPINNG